MELGNESKRLKLLGVLVLGMKTTRDRVAEVVDDNTPSIRSHGMRSYFSFGSIFEESEINDDREEDAKTTMHPNYLRSRCSKQRDHLNLNLEIKIPKFDDTIDVEKVED